MVTLQTPLVLREALYGPAGAPSAHGCQAYADWLSSHYHGGNVLITYVNSPSMMFYLLTKDRFADDSLITDANGPQFEGALAAPQKWVTWIVMNSDASNGASADLGYPPQAHGMAEVFHLAQDVRHNTDLREACTPCQLPRRKRRPARRARLLAALAAAGILALGIGIAAAFHGSSQPGAALQLHVSGNELVNATGQQVILRGVDRSGGEYSCVGGTGIWDGPMGPAAVAAMKGWHVNAVRVPLNEACWNGQSYVNPAYAGRNYQKAVAAYVRLLNRNGMVALLDLHWSDGTYTGKFSSCGSAEALCQKPMPDRAQAIPFWNSVARTFAGNDAVIFDLFNEPFPGSRRQRQ